MSGLWCEHFLEYPNDTELLDGVFAEMGWTLGTQPFTPPRVGSKYLEHTSSAGVTGRVRRIFGAPKTGAGYGFRYYRSALPSTDDSSNGGSGTAWWFLAANGIGQFGVFLGSDGSLIVCKGPFAGSGTGGFTQVARSNPCITARTWQYVELKCIPLASGGTFEVRVNGTTVVNYVGNTDPETTGEVSQMMIQAAIGAASFQEGVTDLHAWDTTAGNGPQNFTGNIGVLRRELDGDTAAADWSLSTGVTGYTLLIDENDATYIEATAIGMKSAFQAAALGVGVTGILYQQVKWRGTKTDSADCDVAPSLQSGSGETDVTGQHMTTLETFRWGIFADDPLTGAPWTLAAANASLPAVTRTL